MPQGGASGLFRSCASGNVSRTLRTRTESPTGFLKSALSCAKRRNISYGSWHKEAVPPHSNHGIYRTKWLCINGCRRTNYRTSPIPGNLLEWPSELKFTVQILFILVLKIWNYSAIKLIKCREHVTFCEVFTKLKLFVMLKCRKRRTRRWCIQYPL